MRYLIAACFSTVLWATTASAEWRSSAEEDVVTATFVGIASTSSRGDDRRDPGTLMVVCRSDDRAYIAASRGRFLSSAGNNISAVIRFDRREPFHIEMKVSADGTSARFKSRSMLIESLSSYTTLRVRLFDYRGAGHDAEFSLVGFRDAYADACSWHSDFSEPSGQSTGDARPSIARVPLSSETREPPTPIARDADTRQSERTAWLAAMREAIRGQASVDLRGCIARLHIGSEGNVKDAEIRSCGDSPKPIYEAIDKAMPLPMPMEDVREDWVNLAF